MVCICKKRGARVGLDPDASLNMCTQREGVCLCVCGPFVYVCVRVVTAVLIPVRCTNQSHPGPTWLSQPAEVLGCNRQTRTDTLHTRTHTSICSCWYSQHRCHACLHRGMGFGWEGGGTLCMQEHTFSGPFLNLMHSNFSSNKSHTHLNAWYHFGRIHRHLRLYLDLFGLRSFICLFILTCFVRHLDLILFSSSLTMLASWTGTDTQLGSLHRSWWFTGLTSKARIHSGPLEDLTLP